MPAYALKDIAQQLNARLIGDGALTVERLVHPKDAQGPADLILAFDNTLHSMLDNSPAKAAVLASDQEAVGEKFAAALLLERPRAALSKLTALFALPLSSEPGIHPTSVIHPTATIGKNVRIGPLCTVGARAEIGEGTQMESHVSIGADVKVGRDCLLYGGVRLGERVKIGDRVILHFNSAIGSDGFSFVTPSRGSAEMVKETASGSVEAFNTEILRIHSLGAVVLGDDVEVGACSTIDRGTVTDTVIGRNTKVDNQVQIAHNVVIGENCMICGCAGIAGSVVIGDRVILGGLSGVADHVKIGDDSVLSAGAVAASNLPAKGVYMGFPAMPRERFREQFLYLSRLKADHKRVLDM
ncbi:MAG TPA: UDP-3-O-(3-hydroxymyristoyl)glucosamine N-acyltransferase, partial [Alphaproteobacteria bacterium]|nr:UDP-3-O-(3-hydroxymyristoyl)glucosamine N-acyltransferase [Alphaproteobacteria bacterium]